MTDKVQGAVHTGHGPQSPAFPDSSAEITRAGSRKYEEIYGQMDRYLPAEHQLAVSLRPESEGYDFWLGDFVQNVQRLLAE